jgi:flagellar basal-body rod protein FlgF
MDSTLYVALSHMNAMRRRMDMTANNVANMNTHGYREEKPLFQEILQKDSRSQGVSYVQDARSVRNVTNGPLEETGHTYDVALQGAGFFAVKHPTTGEVTYTRDGRFRVNNTGQLVNTQGFSVMGEGGAALSIPTTARQVVITSDGTILADAANVGQMQVAQFDNELLLKKMEDGRYQAPPTLSPNGKREGVQVMQGMIEGSNVNPVVALTEMVDIARGYERAERIVSNEDERIRDAIRKLSGRN